MVLGTRVSPLNGLLTAGLGPPEPTGCLPTVLAIVGSLSSPQGTSVPPRHSASRRVVRGCAFLWVGHCGNRDRSGGVSGQVLGPTTAPLWFSVCPSVTGTEDPKGTSVTLHTPPDVRDGQAPGTRVHAGRDARALYSDLFPFTELMMLS